MKVKNCCAKETVKPEPKRLSFEEIKKKEGIYRPVSSDTRIEVRVIVLFGEEETAVLFYSKPAAYLQTATPRYWRNIDFIKCEDEEVCFEIRKKGS